jgi:hypothetical protein
MKIRSFVNCCSILIVMLFISPANGENGNKSDDITQIEISIKQRQVQVENKTLRITQGQTVEMLWQSDEAVELHLHGYDIEFKVVPREISSVILQAHATGRFPITSHGFSGESGHGHKALLYVEVYPE